MLASFVFAMLSHACRCRFEEAGPRPGSTRASRGSSNLATLLDSTWQDQQERLAAVSGADPPAPPQGSARATLGSPNLAALLDTNWQGQLEQLVRGRTEALQAGSTGEVHGQYQRTAGRQHWNTAREDLMRCMCAVHRILRRGTRDLQAGST